MFILVVVSIVLMTLDHKFNHMDTVRTGLSTLLYPVQLLVNMPSDVGDWASDTFKSRKTLQEENLSLQTQNRLLKAEQQKFNYVKTENMHLRALLKSSREISGKVLIAELLSVDLDPYKRQVVINKGSQDGVFVGQPMVDAHGVMGLVTHTGLKTSTALLITDPNHSLPVQFLRTGLRAVASGTGDKNRYELLYLPNSADIKEGDVFVTSGLGCVFPTGYPAGKITKITTDPSLPFAQVKAEPIARLNQSREVLLVWPSESNQGGENPCKLNQEIN